MMHRLAMLRLADFFAVLTIVLLLALLGFGAAMQLELLEPGIQVFTTTERGPGVGWTLYAPISTEQQPGSFNFDTARIWHMILAMAVLFSLTMLAASLAGSHRLLSLSAALAALWLSAMIALPHQPILNTAYFQQGEDPLVWLMLGEFQRISIWHLVPFRELGPVDSFLAFAAILAIVPLVGLVLLVSILVKLGPGTLRTWAFSAAALTALLALSPGLEPRLADTQMHTVIGHMTLGAISIYVTSFLLLRWLALHGRGLRRDLVFGFAVLVGLVLLSSLFFTANLAQRGMPSRYLDYPDAFAWSQFIVSLHRFALAGLVSFFLGAVAVRRLMPVRSDETTDIF